MERPVTARERYRSGRAHLARANPRQSQTRASFSRQMVTSSRPHTSRTDAPSSRAQRCGVGAANARRRGLLRGLSSLGRLITGRLRGRRRTGSSLGRLRLRLRASHLQAFSLIQLAWRHGGMSGRLLERDTHTTHARDALAALSRRNRTLAQGRTFACNDDGERPPGSRCDRFRSPAHARLFRSNPLSHSVSELRVSPNYASRWRRELGRV